MLRRLTGERLLPNENFTRTPLANSMAAAKTSCSPAGVSWINAFSMRLVWRWQKPNFFFTILFDDKFHLTNLANAKTVDQPSQTLTGIFKGVVVAVSQLNSLVHNTLENKSLLLCLKLVQEPGAGYTIFPLCGKIACVLYFTRSS